MAGSELFHSKKLSVLLVKGKGGHTCGTTEQADGFSVVNQTNEELLAS